MTVSGQTFADGQFQLRAPLNSTLKMRGAETTWTKRPPSADAKAKSPSTETLQPAADSASNKDAEQDRQTTESPRQSQSDKKIEATPASGPLDRFRNPLTKSPSLRTGTATPDQGLGAPVATTPAEGSSPKDATPALPSTNAWRGRAVAGRTNAVTAAPATQSITQQPDGFRPPATEGNWVARDAINRIAPLRDPALQTQTAPIQPASQPLPETKSEVTENSSSDTDAKNVSAASPTLIAPKAVTGNDSKSASPSHDDFTRRSGSMSLQEAESAVSAEPSEDAKSEPDNKTAAVPTRKDQSLSLGKPQVNEQAEPQAQAEPIAQAKPQTQADSQQPIAEPSETSNSRAESEAKPKAEAATPDSTAKKDEPQKRKTLPKRKPLQNIVDAEMSSSKSSAEQPKTTTRRNSPVEKEDTSASVGDLPPVENQVLDYTGRPASSIQPTRTVAGMRRGMERTLRYFYDRAEVANGRSNWGMMHSLMVFGADTKIIVGRQKYSAIAWIAGNNNCRGQRLLTHDAEGIQAKSGVGLQGHQGQFLAVLGMCNVPTNYPLHAGKMKYDVAELIEAEKKACKEGTELTFTLIGLAHYLDTDTTWTADDGTEWGFERIIAEELKQPIVGAACGGTHRLMGYTHALRKRRAEGKPITGHWKRAEIYTQDFIRYAYSLQNRDGSMSTKWFEGRADNGKVDRKIQTTGHIVEWLLTATPDDQLQDRRLVAAVNFLLRAVGSDLDHDWSIGPKGHALRSLAMYHQRVFHAGTPWIPESIARSSKTGNRR